MFKSNINIIVFAVVVFALGAFSTGIVSSLSAERNDHSTTFSTPPHPLTGPVVLGDINLSGDVDILDLTILAEVIKQKHAADYNQDGKIDTRDYNDLVQYLFGNK